MKPTLPLIILAVGSLVPAAVAASTIAAAAVPDGTYTVKVEKVVDSRHVDVLFENGSETTLPAGRSSVDFSKVQTNDQLKLSVISGSVMVYVDLTKTS